MENEDQNPPLQVPSEENNFKHIVYPDEGDKNIGTNSGNTESEESRNKKHDADSGNDGTSNAMLQKEKIIDPGNEHHHQANESDKNANKKNINPPSKHDTDAGVDRTGTTGPITVNGDDDLPDTDKEGSE